MSDAQRETLHQKQWNDFDQRYGAWLNGLDQRKLDLRSLPRYPLNASIVPGQPTLHDAVATADLVVVGTVLSIAPTKYSGTATVVSVDQTVKGPVAPAVAVTQAGGLRPTQDWTGVTIAEGENGGLLLPGDRAVLLLQKHSTGYEIQSVSGWYVVVNGLVRANRLNAWGRSVDGETETAFIQQLQAAAQ